MALPGLVRCAAGMTLAARPGPRDGSAHMRVGPVGPVTIPSGAPMEACHVGGDVWRRHWTHDGHLVCEFTDVACVALDPDGTITFDRDLDPEMEEHLLFDHLLPLVLAGDGHLVLHGGIVSRRGRGVALIGSSGAGKSTLAGYLWGTGWTLGSDDGVVVTASPTPRAEPTYATLRLTPAAADLIGVHQGDTSPVAGKLRLHPAADRGFRQEPVDLVAVALVLPDEDPQAIAAFTPLGGIDAHAELFGATFHSDFAPDRRLPGVFSELAGVVDACTVGRLSVPRGCAGLSSAAELLRRLVEEPAGR